MIFKCTDVRVAREQWLDAVKKHYPTCQVFDSYHGMFAIDKCKPSYENGYADQCRVGHYDRMIGGFVY